MAYTEMITKYFSLGFIFALFCILYAQVLKKSPAQ